jgi:hypothetical protein
MSNLPAAYGAPESGDERPPVRPFAHVAAVVTRAADAVSDKVVDVGDRRVGTAGRVIEQLTGEQIVITRFVLVPADLLAGPTLERTWRSAHGLVVVRPVGGDRIRTGRDQFEAGAIWTAPGTVWLAANWPIRIECTLAPIGATATELAIRPHRRGRVGISWLRRRQWFATLNPIADQMVQRLVATAR